MVFETRFTLRNFSVSPLEVRTKRALSSLKRVGQMRVIIAISKRTSKILIPRAILQIRKRSPTLKRLNPSEPSHQRMKPLLMPKRPTLLVSFHNRQRKQLTKKQAPKKVETMDIDDVSEEETKDKEAPVIMNSAPSMGLKRNFCQNK